MRIDLALQRIHLALSAFGLLTDDLLHQILDLLIRLLDRISKMPDLG